MGMGTPVAKSKLAPYPKNHLECWDCAMSPPPAHATMHVAMQMQREILDKTFFSKCVNCNVMIALFCEKNIGNRRAVRLGRADVINL